MEKNNSNNNLNSSATSNVSDGARGPDFSSMSGGQFNNFMFQEFERFRSGIESRFAEQRGEQVLREFGTNIRLANMEQHQVIYHQDQANVNAAVNRLENRVDEIQRMTDQQFRIVLGKIEELAKTKAQEVEKKIKPKPGEEKLLEDILGKKELEAMKNKSNKEMAEKLESFASDSLNTALGTVGIIMDNANLKDKNELKDQYKNIFKDFCNSCSVIPAVGAAIGLLDLFIQGFVAADEAIKKADEKKKFEKQLKEKADELEQKLIEMTTDGDKYGFEKANITFLARYFATYDRDDVSYEKDSLDYEQQSWYQTAKIFGMSPEYGHRSYSKIPGYKEYFSRQCLVAERLEFYRAEFLKVTGKHMPEYSRIYFDLIKKEDYLSFVKEDKRNEFEVKYKEYRALREKGECDNLEDYKDKDGLSRGFACLGLCFIGIGIFTSVELCIESVQNKNLYKENISNLKNVMGSCLKVPAKLELILKAKCVLAKLKFYNDCEKTGYGQNLFENNNGEFDYLFKDEQSKTLFESAFDLYQKMTHTGIADRKNYINFNFLFKSAESPYVPSAPLAPSSEIPTDSPPAYSLHVQNTQNTQKLASQI